MTGDNNWTKKKVSNGIRWTHNSNRRVAVDLYQHEYENPKKVVVYHYHPAPYGHVILQKPEVFRTMKAGMQSVEMHLKHWNDPGIWKKDPDYGKLGKKP